MALVEDSRDWTNTCLSGQACQVLELRYHNLQAIKLYPDLKLSLSHQGLQVIQTIPVLYARGIIAAQYEIHRLGYSHDIHTEARPVKFASVGFLREIRHAPDL